MKQLHEKLQTLGHFFEPLYVGSYWVGLQNAFDLLEKLPGALEKDKHLLSNCFVMAVEMSHTTLQELHEQPCERLP